MDFVKTVYLIGVGGISRIVVDMVRTFFPQWSVGGYFDDEPEKIGREFDGIGVLGTFKDLLAGGDKKAVFNCIGNIRDMKQRINYSSMLLEKGFVFPSFIHPGSSTSPAARVGEGTLVCPQAVINTHARVGFNVVVFSGSIIEHDAAVGDNCYLSPHVAVCGKATVEENCYIGPGTVLGAGVTVGRNSIVGAGAVVLDDLPAGGFYVGSPARHLKKNELW